MNIPTAILTTDSARMPLLMPDDFVEMHNVSWRVEEAVPDPSNPLIEGQAPWDAGGIMTHGTVLHDPQDGLWKAWIACTPSDEVRRQGSLGTDNYPEKLDIFRGHEAHRRICYFESRDGISWLRPELPFHRFGDIARTNILFGGPDVGGAQYASVLINPDQSEWRYEMFLYAECYSGVDERKKMSRYRSRDGKRWEFVGRVTGPFTSDVCYVYRESDGTYVAYYRLYNKNVELERKVPSHKPPYDNSCNIDGIRTLYRATSSDGNQFSEGEVIAARDERDHADTQYMELVPLRVPGGLLGLLTMYHPLTQTLDLRLAASRDGSRWWYPDRRPCLANAPLGDYGGGMFWQAKDLFVEGERVFVYYGASEGIHRTISDTRAKRLEEVGYQERVIAEGAEFLPFNSALCRASWRIDRLYALAPAIGGPTIGTALTRPQDLSRKRLCVNFVTRPAKKGSQPGMDEGYLQVELLDQQGRPLPGFARADCPELRGDQHALDVRWAGGEQAPAGAVQARFYLKRAFLYGFTAQQILDT